MLPILVAAALLVGLLVTYPYATLTVVTLLYLALIPVSLRRFQDKQRQWDAENPVLETLPGAAAAAASPSIATGAVIASPPTETKH